jgi:hypothetical protein
MNALIRYVNDGWIILHTITVKFLRVGPISRK